jgi:hypothetical protein
MSLRHVFAAGLCAVVLSGCSSLVAPPYSADYDVLDGLKKTPLAKVAVAPVRPTDAAAPVNKITLRGANLVGPKGTFAAYLEDALIEDLRELSVYDAGAAVLLQATILKNDIDVSGLSVGTGRMDVALSVTRGGVPLLNKTYTAATQFESSFAGAVAIPRGQSEYGALVRKLLSSIYADPEFKAALKP